SEARGYEKEWVKNPVSGKWEHQYKANWKKDPMTGGWKQDFVKRSTPAFNDERAKVRWEALQALQARAGNCSELSAVAYKFLDEAGVRPLERVYLAAPGDHVFTVLGRDPWSDLQDVRTWGCNAFVCDPWANLAFKAKDYPTLWVSRMMEWGAKGEKLAPPP